MKKSLLLYYSFCLVFLFSCEPNQEESAEMKFQLLSSEQTGIVFSNDLTENDSMNYFNYGYIYMGGGVAVGDLNNDDLPDVYFTGNMVQNALYLNQGDLKFIDITSEAGVGAGNEWITGVTMADVNADGWLDIYVSVSGIWSSTKNLLYINQGLNDEGVPSFTERAEDFGIADEGNSIQAVFFDYDLDNDLDLLVANYPVTPFESSIVDYLKLEAKVTSKQSSTLYENNGNGLFTDVTEEAGLLKYSLAVSTAVGDFNQDGYPDIYVSNDFTVSDYFFLNNGDGTFREKIQESTNQTSLYGMGTDAADINNDGLLDFVQLDMTPENNRRAKANMRAMNVEMFNQMTSLGFHHQYMYNTMQLNNGTDVEGTPLFSNIGAMAGISKTDWSWASLLADFDNDGWKDLFVTNGTRREINNRDFFGDLQEKSKEESWNKVNLLEIVSEIPSERIDNYAFRNSGDLRFEKVAEKWGLNFSGFSNGAAYADLDNDGDLDLLINNLDDRSLLFENRADAIEEPSNYLKIKFNGPAQNPLGIGTKVVLSHQGSTQFQELILTRGYQSSVEPIVHFGLGTVRTIDEVKIIWPDGKIQFLDGINSNQTVTIDYLDASEAQPQIESNNLQVFEDITKQSGISHHHQENSFDDYSAQVLLPHKMSQFGPALAVADINNDGLDDFFVGGAAGFPGAIFTQTSVGSFETSPSGWLKSDQSKEDVGALFFDANNDGFQDLYVVSGGNEFYPNSDMYQDRLYMNDGSGGFKKVGAGMPKLRSSGSVVKPVDFDHDGDLDLFIGGRHTPQNYPLPADSYLLKNESEDSRVEFTDVTDQLAPDLKEIGMITDATWVDMDDDGSMDLVVVGEWMGITVLLNKNGKFESGKLSGLENSIGWWYSLASGDFDNDGDQDLVAGNLGLNYKYKASAEAPFDVYASDFDNNRSPDIVLGFYQNGVQYPVRGRECSSQQIEAIRYKFKDYNSFSEANLEDIYSTEGLEEALHYEAVTFASSYIENLGDGNFKIHELPTLAQLSSVNSIIVDDYDQDGFSDLVIAGNLFVSEVETPRNDASFGLYLLGKGDGSFESVPSVESGLYVSGDVKHGTPITLAGGRRGLLFVKNNDYIQLVEVNQ